MMALNILFVCLNAYFFLSLGSCFLVVQEIKESGSKLLLNSTNISCKKKKKFSFTSFY